MKRKVQEAVEPLRYLIEVLVKKDNAIFSKKEEQEVAERSLVAKNVVVRRKVR